LVSTADLILTKNAILQKVNKLLVSLQEEQKKYLALHPAKLPDEVLQSSPKISKGENYKGLPYLILDYPKSFQKENIFAIRTMFWWGHFFSVTLHLSGTYKKATEQQIINSCTSLKEKGFYCCINDNEWEHHFETSNYIPMIELNNAKFENLVSQKLFIKLGNIMQLPSWDDTEEILLGYFKEIIELLAD
jgi:hypothetical protein